MKGYKIFIDELDANISGVFLDRLLEFFAENGQGQLCFTSHNIMSMNILKQYKNSITVFGETGKVVNVVKNGHYQPVNLYYEGFVEDSPFNINSFDFYKKHFCFYVLYIYILNININDVLSYNSLGAYLSILRQINFFLEEFENFYR